MTPYMLLHCLCEGADVYAALCVHDDRAFTDCLVELLTAIDAGVPIVGVALMGTPFLYDFGQAASFLASLDMSLEIANPGASAILRQANVHDLADAARQLGGTIPQVISVAFNTCASRRVIQATVGDLVSSMLEAKALPIPSRAEWASAKAELSRATSGKAALSRPESARQDSTGQHGQVGAAKGTATLDAQRSLATIPPEVPELPMALHARPALVSALKESVLEPCGQSTTAITAPRRSAATTAAHGMGGVGKSVAVALLVRDPEVITTPVSNPDGIHTHGSQLLLLRAAAARATLLAIRLGRVSVCASCVRQIGAAFQRLLWVSVSQTPDLLRLLQRLYYQLTSTTLPSEVDEVSDAVQALREAAKGIKALLVLDDCWDAASVETLNVVDAAAGSACVITTRMRNLAPSELSCGLLTADEALSLLLMSAGLEHLLDEKKPSVGVACDGARRGAQLTAARAAVERCGRLPLALAIAGGMIPELGDSWDEQLVEFLSDEFDEQSLEERVVGASLRVVPQAIRPGVEALFCLCAVFAEDALVPIAAIDVLATGMLEGKPSLLESNPGKKGTVAASTFKRNVRKWLQQLLKGNLLRGSVDTGISVHDLVRDCMIQRAQDSCDDGLCSMQRKAVALLVESFNAEGPAVNYVSHHLFWHIGQARMSDTPIHEDSLLMSVLTHENGNIRRHAALGVGLGTLIAGADACDALNLHYQAAQLHFACCAVKGTSCGLEARRAIASLEQVEETNASHAHLTLEMRVLNVLNFATRGGYTSGSVELTRVHERMKEVASMLTAGPGSDVADGTDDNTSEELTNAEYSLALGGLVGELTANAVMAYTVVTRDKVVESHGHALLFAKHIKNAAKAAPTKELRVICSGLLSHPAINCSRQLMLEGYKWDDFCGEDGSWLRNTVNEYDFRTVHPVAKGFGVAADAMMYGMDAACLLLRYGDLATARASWVKVLDAHKQVMQRFELGEVQVENYSYEIWYVFHTANSLLMAGEHGLLEEFLANSLAGLTLTNDAVREGLQGIWSTFSWKSDEGHIHSTRQSWLLMVRALDAMTQANSDTTRSTLREWLPSCAELTRIAEFELVHLAISFGECHPSLLCASLHGERLGAWDVAVAVAKRLLEVEPFNPLLRIAANRLLSRAHRALGHHDTACEAALQAADEAANSGCRWLEMLALRDWLRCSESGDEAEVVRSRLGSVTDGLAASAEEVAAVLEASR